jgi:plastocyanin
MSVRRLMVALAVVATVVGAIASSVLGAGSQVQTTTVKVSALDTLKFTLSRKSAPHGTVKFVVTNKGVVSHDFWIAGKKTPKLGKNKSATVTVTLKKGKYAYKCTVDGHAVAGMRGTFTAT